MRDTEIEPSTSRCFELIFFTCARRTPRLTADGTWARKRTRARRARLERASDGQVTAHVHVPRPLQQIRARERHEGDESGGPHG